MAFDLEPAIHELVLDFASDKVFVDFILSRMFFSGLQVTQQVTSDRFGTGVGLFGHSAGSGRTLILLTPLGIQTASFLPAPPIEMLKLARLDLLIKIWMADRLLESLNPPDLMIAAYRMDPLGSGLATLFDDLIRPRCDKSATAVMFASDVNGPGPVKVVFRPAMVTTSMPIPGHLSAINGHRSFTVTVSNRKRLDWLVLLDRLSAFHDSNDIVLSDLMLGGWDRSQPRFAAFTVTTGSSIPEWPGQWRVRELRAPNHLKGGWENALRQLKASLCSFGNPGVTPVFLHARDGFVDCTYMMSPQMVTDFVSSAKKNGAHTEMIDLYDSEQPKPGKGLHWLGAVSLLQPLTTYLSAPPVSMVRDHLAGVSEWVEEFLNFLKKV